MNEQKSLLKTFLVYGLGMLGCLYIFSISMFRASVEDRFDAGSSVEWFLTKAILIFLICISAIALVIRKIWIAGKGPDGRSLWVYPAISFIILVSLSLLFLIPLGFDFLFF